MNILKKLKEYYFGKTIEDKIELARAYIGVFVIILLGLKVGWFGSLRW